MHTQNVNVRTAAQESSRKMGEEQHPMIPHAHCLKSMHLRTDGFVRNIRSRNPFDVISADVILARMEKQANKNCGLCYEIYETRLLGMAMHYLSQLPLKDRPIFMGAAMKRGFMLTLAELERAESECDD